MYNMCKVERFVLTILKEDYYSSSVRFTHGNPTVILTMFDIHVHTVYAQLAFDDVTVYQITR